MLRSTQGIILNQRKYILKLKFGIGLAGAKPTSTPLESNIIQTSVEFDKTTGLTGDVVLKDITSYQR